LIEGFGAGGVPSADDERRNLAGIRGTLSADTDAATARGREAAGGGLLGGLFDTRTDAATIQEPEIDARPIFDSGGMSQDEYDRVRGRTEARMRREQPDMVNNFVDDDGVEADEQAMTGGMGEADEVDPVGLLDLPRGNNGLFGEDPLGPKPMGDMRPLTRNSMVGMGEGDFNQNAPGSGLAPIVPQEYASAPFAPPQEAAPMNQPVQAPMQPQQPPLDPNAWSGGDWIPPDIGMQLAQAQMRGGVPQADMPVQGAATAQGMPQAPQQPAQAEQLPAPPPGGMGGVAPVAQPQQAAQAPAPSGEPSPMRQAFADMLGAIGQSLMETGDLRGVGRAMQGLRLAGMERSKSRAEQNAIVAALRTAMPNATDEFLYTLAGDPSGRAGRIAMDAAQAAQQQALAAQAQEHSERTAAEFASEAERFAVHYRTALRTFRCLNISLRSKPPCPLGRQSRIRHQAMRLLRRCVPLLRRRSRGSASLSKKSPDTNKRACSSWPAFLPEKVKTRLLIEI
jgi:hypothetical protein